MPTYEYACTACTHRFERVQKFSDDPVTECPECSGKVRKVYFAAGVVFKGSGWYINDSRPSAPSETSSAPSETSSAPSAAVTPEPASETKSDAAAPASALAGAPASPAPATTGTGTTSSSSPASA